jgi:1-phosphofructokinase family hexose kinase
MLNTGLARLGIRTDFVQITGETRTNTVIEEAHSGHYIKVNEAGPSIEPVALDALRARILARLNGGSYWALCGSLPPGAPPDLYANLVTLIQSQGAFACLDASGVALRYGLQAAPFLVKPNAEEAAEIAGFPITDLPSAQRAATVFLEQGATVVALSLGADGLLLARREQNLYACPPQVAVQTPVGVGDALLAGLLYALQHKLPFDDMARWGVATGTAAAMTPGVGVGTLAEVTRLLGDVILA